MANPEHIRILRAGVEVWNQWRKKNSDVEPDLRGANLQGANLRKVRLSNAQLTEANFKNADLTNADFVKANLHEADFSEAILSRANFYRAVLTRSSFLKADCRNTIFSKANLEKSNLQKAELMATLALKTNFADANITGACIQDWSINSETNLKSIKCDYIYLKSRWERNIRKVFFEERRPHDPQKIFAPGDFERLVRKAQETVDLIFRNGVDWSAFLSSYEELKIEAGGNFLPIQAIENKGEGSFIVRIQAPPELDKGQIQKSFETQYKRALKLKEQQYRERLNAKDKEIEVYREQNTNLWEIVKLKASQPFNIIQQQGDSTISNDNRIQGIGEMKGGTIQGNAKVGGIINEAEQRNLAEAAAEIQQLLEQLDKSYPSDTMSGRMQIATEAISQIENDSDLMTRILSALKAGGVSAFEQFLNHPAASFVMGALEDWQKTKES